MSNNQAIIERSRRHHQAETYRQTVHLPGQTLGHFGDGSSTIRVFCQKAAGMGNTIQCTDNPWPRSWDNEATYAEGKIVCIDTTEDVYVSLQGSNHDHSPATSPTWWKIIPNWNSTVIYTDDTYEYVFGTDGLIYHSKEADNENNLITDTDWWEPVGGWDNGTTYALEDIVFGSDNNLYTSLEADNQGNDPVSSPTKWTVFATRTVVCKLYEYGQNLQYCRPILHTHDELPIEYIDGAWRAMRTFYPICGSEAL